ncbi:MFS transporter [Buchnera aphidicola (Mindarus keteleerifoliae)]|uniref:MFS transporter n=1 Tax=Buchnera aphidicola TaxID=9 RepID=UPI0031B688D4
MFNLIKNKKRINVKKSFKKTRMKNALNKDFIKPKKKLIRKKTKEFRKIAISFFFAGFSTFSVLYCVQPILPIFSKEFHLTPSQSSLSLSAATVTMAIGMLFTGSFSDFLGRKKIMTISLFTSAMLTILCSFTNSWNQIIIMRLLIGLALSGVTAVGMSYLSEEIHPNDLSFSIGLYISGNTFGGFIGRFLSTIISNYFSWKSVFLTLGFFSFFSTIIFLTMLPSSKNFRSISLDYISFIKNFLLHLQDKALIILFLIGFILMGSFITLFNYIGYRLMISPFFLDSNLISLLSIVYLTGVYSSPKAGTLIHRYNRSTILFFSFIIMIIGLSITQLNNYLSIFLGLILFSGGFFSAHSIASSWIGYRVKKAKGQASSMYLISYYFGASVLGTVGGFFWSFGCWLGISIFILNLLFIGIFLSLKLKKILKL